MTDYIYDLRNFILFTFHTPQTRDTNNELFHLNPSLSHLILLLTDISVGEKQSPTSAYGYHYSLNSS